MTSLLMYMLLSLSVSSSMLAQTTSIQSSSSGDISSTHVAGSAGSSKSVVDKAGDKSVAAEINPNEPVITLQGVCKNAKGDSSESSSCKTVVTRREFEALLEAINLSGKEITSGARQNLAKTYAQYLVYEQPALAAGLDKTKQFAQIMEWLRLRMLDDLLKQRIVDQYRSASDEDIHRYYEQHILDFDRVEVKRILIPRVSPKKATGTVGEEEKARQMLAQDTRDRLSKGEDPDAVQRDVFMKLKMGDAPSMASGKKGRSDFIEEESKELFSLKAGDISQVEEELTSYVIYKLVARETLPESEVKDQISREIVQANVRKANQEITDPIKAEYNDKYFGPPASEPLPMPLSTFHP